MAKPLSPRGHDRQSGLGRPADALRTTKRQRLLRMPDRPLRTPPPLRGRSARALYARAGRGVLALLHQTPPSPSLPLKGGRRRFWVASTNKQLPFLGRGVAT